MRSFVASILVLLVSVSAFAEVPIEKQDLLDRRFESADRDCAVAIEESGAWSADCELLESKFGASKLAGEGIEFFSPYGNPKYQGVEFKGKLPQRLQAFVARDPKDPEIIVLGLVYGSPADGKIEPLFVK